MRAKTLARRFHETYERLAPEYGYTTREASAVPWEDVPDDNRRLMIATAAEVLRPRPWYDLVPVWQAAVFMVLSLTVGVWFGLSVVQCLPCEQPDIVASGVHLGAMDGALHGAVLGSQGLKCGENLADGEFLTIEVICPEATD